MQSPTVVAILGGAGGEDGGEGGESRQILKPLPLTEASVDQLSDEASTPPGPFEPEYVTLVPDVRGTVTLS